ncbi:MAG: glycosyl hydrolase, partial [Verrucomicrobiota bacterium]
MNAPMNIRKLMRMAVVAVLLAGTAALAAEDLERGFQAPPDSARPWVYWFWMNGNITREGITADLEAMQRVGIRGALIMDVASPQAPLVEFGSPGWHALLKFAVEEARRLGLEIELHNAPSWAGSGGPWITPENAMKVVVTSEKRVQGPRRFEEALPQPPSNLGFYRDVAVLAFRTPATELSRMSDLAPKVTVSTPGEDGAKVMDGRADSFVKLALPKSEAQPFILFEFAQPYTAGMVRLKIVSPIWKASGQLEFSQDGKEFKPLAKLACNGKAPECTVYFAPICAKFFRFVLRDAATLHDLDHVKVAELELSPQLGIADFSEKIFEKREWGPARFLSEFPAAAQGAVAQESLLDLSGKMKADGKLAWEIPEGSWTLLRVGYTANGKLMAPAPQGGEGLVCDNLSRKAAQVHWDAHMRRIVENLGPLAGNVATGLNNVEIDSYESGCQNWTDGFEKEFQRRRGYELTKFLPVFTGRVVDSPEVTERFLWDFRRTVTDLFNEDYVGQMAAMAHEAGLRLSI